MNLADGGKINVLPVPEAGELGKGGAMAQVRAAVKFGAGRLLTGARTRDGQAIRASLSLVDATRNRILWGAESDAGNMPLPKLAASLAGGVSRALGVAPRKLYDQYFYVTGSPAMAASPELIEALGALRRCYAPLAATERLVAAFPGEADAYLLRAAALHYEAWYFDASTPKRRAGEAGLAVLERMDPGNPWIEMFRADFFARDG